MRRCLICWTVLVGLTGILLAQMQVGRVQLSEGVGNSRVTYRVAPKYPASARKARIQGDVRLDVVVEFQ